MNQNEEQLLKLALCQMEKEAIGLAGLLTSPIPRIFGSVVGERRTRDKMERLGLGEKKEKLGDVIIKPDKIIVGRYEIPYSILKYKPEILPPEVIKKIKQSVAEDILGFAEEIRKIKQGGALNAGTGEEKV